MNSVCKWGAAGCPLCLCPSLPTSKYLHPGSCTCYNWLGRLGRLVTPLPDVRDTHQVSPRSWKNHLSKVGMTEFSFWLLEINTKESERPPGRDQQECTKPDLQKKALLCQPLCKIFQGKGDGSPHCLQVGSHELLDKEWELWETKLIQDFSPGLALFSRFSLFLRQTSFNTRICLIISVQPHFPASPFLLRTHLLVNVKSGT